MIKLICCDLDGTLLDSKKNISEINKNAIKEFKDKGGHFVIATGRPLDGVLPIIKELDLLNDLDATICYNGSVIRLNKTKKILDKTTISGRIVKELYIESIRLNTYFHFFSEKGVLYTAKKNEYTAVEEKINHIEAIEVDPLSFIKDNDLFIKAMMVGREECLDKAREKLDPKFLSLSVSRSSKIFLEFQDKSVSKGHGLKFLEKYYNLEHNQTLAFGDEENDISMIKEAFIGVAMSNARDIVKECANDITLSCEESGVGVYINKILKGVTK